MKKIFFICMLLFIKVQSQNFSVTIGTDVPYQHYIGTNFETKNIDISYRTGLFLAPYSNMILNIAKDLGISETYVNLLDATFQFGWMNSIGINYKFGKQKLWYIGPEFRIDHFTAADTPESLIEEITGKPSNIGNNINKNIELKLGLRTMAIGFRFGKSFSLDTNHKHYIKTEISLSKHISNQTILKGNSNNLNAINEELDKLLWEDIFKNYGFIGGVGLAYSYNF